MITLITHTNGTFDAIADINFILIFILISRPLFVPKQFTNKRYIPRAQQLNIRFWGDVNPSYIVAAFQTTPVE